MADWGEGTSIRGVATVSSMAQDMSLDPDGGERKTTALRSLLVAGETSGEPAPFDLERFVALKRATARGEDTADSHPD
ncbi:MAG: type II toxin-antitoxin system ParD family antitoxin [Microthrixaceae bacterium]|nr:type II toxin-antitoxin system ParD family antitoxin [Microthrixaceae bacterium]